MVGDLNLRWELQQVTHQIGDLSLIDVTLSISIDDLESLLDLLPVEFLLTGLLNWVSWCWQHLYFLSTF